MVLNKEITGVIFLVNYLVSANGRDHVNVLNTTDYDKKLGDFDCEWQDYHILKPEKQRKGMIKKILALLSSLGIDTYHSKAIQSINKSFNNSFQQRIQTTDFPVYMKNYRLPQKHIEEINIQVEQLLQ